MEVASMGRSKPIGPVETIFTIIGVFALVVIVMAIRESQQEVSQSSSPAPLTAYQQKMLAPPAEKIGEAKQVLAKRNASAQELREVLKRLESVQGNPSEQKEVKALSPKLFKAMSAALEREEIERNPVELVASTWSRGGFDTTAVWQVTFKNRSARRVGNIRYQANYFAETGAKLLSSERVIQRVLEAHQRRTIEVIDRLISQDVSAADFTILGSEFL